MSFRLSPHSASRKQSAPSDWLSTLSLKLPLKEERVTKLRTYLEGDGARETNDNEHITPSDIEPPSNEEQVLYGLEVPRGRIDWKRKPLYPDEPESELIDPKAAYVVRKISKGVGSPWELHSIIVRSPQIMEILRNTLTEYPGISTAVDNLTLSSPFEPIFHRWAALRGAVDSADALTRQHIEGFINLLENELATYFQALQDADKHNIIQHSCLWTIFVPNELVWWDMKQHHAVGKILETGIDPMTGAFSITYEQTVWDGFTLKTKEKSLKIQVFTGTRLITDLNAMPLSRKPDIGRIKALVLERGKKFHSLLGCHYREYLGLGLAKTVHRSPFETPQWEAVSGRIVLDAALWHGKIAERPDPEHVASLSSSKSDNELLTCSPLMKGYSLSTKRWYKVFIDNVSDIVWDDSFPGLVLGEIEKDLLLGFSQTKLTETTSFDDVIRGKGRGVIILLSGPPGVGKTLTVESIASDMRVPLYPLSAGELGIEPESVERQLREALTYCKEWNAVLLLDEADVFLERRSVSQLERNELVSIFLRLLEYYDGMMFLTTNRVNTMDPAFQSRIDLTIPYPHLSESSRAKVWKSFIETNLEVTTGIDYNELASYTLNGRQIKNVVKLAKMLGVRRNEPLQMDHLRQILQLSTRGQASENNPV